MFSVEAGTQEFGEFGIPDLSIPIASNISSGVSPSRTDTYIVSKRLYPSVNQLVNGWRKPARYHRYVRRFVSADSSHVVRPYDKHDFRPIGGSENGMVLNSAFDGWFFGREFVTSSDTLNESIVKSLNRLKDGKAQLGVSLAESKRTFNMLSDSSLQLLAAYRAARRGHWGRVARMFGFGPDQLLKGRYAANSWLAYQYGWKPLMSDIRSMYSLLQLQVARDDFLIKSFASVKRKGSKSDTFNDGPVQYKLRVLRESSCEQDYRTGLYASISSPRWRAAVQTGLLDPLAIGWELVPFSFLLDWFMPVGNVLEALTARTGLTYKGGYTTIRSSGKTTLKVVGVNQGNVSLARSGHATHVCSGVDRRLHTSWPAPLLYVRDSPFSTTRSLNALALWRSTMKGR